MPVEPPPPAARIDKRIEEHISRLWTICPGVVTKIYGSEHRCDVKLKIKVQDPEGNYVELPPLSRVPIGVLKGGNSIIQLPIAVDDTVMVLFTKFSLSGVLSEKKKLVNVLQQGIKFGLVNAIVFGGIFTDDIVDDLPTDRVYIKTDKDVNITATGNVTIEGARIDLNP